MLGYKDGTAVIVGQNRGFKGTDFRAMAIVSFLSIPIKGLNTGRSATASVKTMASNV